MGIQLSVLCVCFVLFVTKNRVTKDATGNHNEHNAFLKKKLFLLIFFLKESQ
jgi:hypothetical protein